MYWPIGAPRIYSDNNSPAGATLESDDEAESRETTEDSGSLIDIPSVEADGNNETGSGLQSGPPTPGSNRVGLDHLTSSLKSPERHKDPILSLRISRTGHLFAVITATSLTIWQTKVPAIICGV